MADYSEPDMAEEMAEAAPEEKPAEERGDTFFISGENIPGAESLKAGETLTFRLVGRDADGQLEVEYANEPETKEEPNELMDRRTAALINSDEGAM